MKKKETKKKVSFPQIEDTSSKWHGPHGKHQTGASAVIFHNLKCVIDLLHNISSLFFLRLTHISKCYTFEDPVETLQRTQTGSNNKQVQTTNKQIVRDPLLPLEGPLSLSMHLLVYVKTLHLGLQYVNTCVPVYLWRAGVS